MGPRLVSRGNWKAMRPASEELDRFNGAATR